MSMKKTPVKSTILLGHEDVERAQDLDRTGDIFIYYIYIYIYIYIYKLPFNCLMTEFLKARNIEELTQLILAQFKTHVGNTQITKSGFRRGQTILTN